jgi:hypothetical protein
MLLKLLARPLSLQEFVRFFYPYADAPILDGETTKSAGRAGVQEY